MKNEANFRQDVRTICQLYHQALALDESGTHVVSVDEKTGIQALERIHPDHAMAKGNKLELHEFEYARHGTQTLIANFEVARQSHHAIDTKDNFEFERQIEFSRSHSLVDMRRKR